MIIKINNQGLTPITYRSLEVKYIGKHLVDAIIHGINENQLDSLFKNLLESLLKEVKAFGLSFIERLESESLNKIIKEEFGVTSWEFGVTS